MTEMYDKSPFDIYVIGDTQVKPKVAHALQAIAYDIVTVKPRVVAHLGDHWDMPSLSSYDRGKLSHVGETYLADIKAGNDAMNSFWDIIQWGMTNDPDWECTFVILEGNHEERIHRAKEEISSCYAGMLDVIERDYTGWDIVGPFLQIIKINGICFSHYFPNSNSGRPISSINAVLSKRHRSCVQGHKQGIEQAEQLALDGTRIMGLCLGSCYYHNEKYKTPQDNCHFRGCAVLRDAFKGEWNIEVRALSRITDQLKGAVDAGTIPNGSKDGNK